MPGSLRDRRSVWLAVLHHALMATARLSGGQSVDVLLRSLCRFYFLRLVQSIDVLVEVEESLERVTIAAVSICLAICAWLSYDAPAELLVIQNRRQDTLAGRERQSFGRRGLHCFAVEARSHVEL